MHKLSRCDWVSDHPLYIDYHDNEWGQIQKDSQSLFELLCLEGQQAGLSWLTILKKRAGYRTCFYNFNPKKIVNMLDEDIELLLQDSRIIRNKLKILAIIQNAKAYLRIKEKQSFSDFLWDTVNHQPIINHWQNISQVPTQTKISQELAKKLQQAGFKFVGPTICYAFMQSTGMVNDHIMTCYRYANSTSCK